ncbi:MAG: hypothetical protein R3A10_19620 [Caldilineaceae bacterium]
MLPWSARPSYRKAPSSPMCPRPASSCGGRHGGLRRRHALRLTDAMHDMAYKSSVAVNPADAARLQVNEGDRVRVGNDQT